MFKEVGIRFLEFAIIVILAQGCYSVKQGFHQSRLLMSAVELEDYRASNSADPKTLQKLDYLDEVLAFAKRAGLDPDGSYESIVFPEGGRVSYLAVAAPYNSLEPLQHWFPFVGTVPYLGFFSEADRDNYLEDKKSHGYDVYGSDVGAFSLLGYFDDPIFPSMLLRSEESMAHLFFHELTHKTLWIQGSSEFNERLAEYVAITLTPLFLKRSNRIDALDRYLARDSDRLKFNSWFKGLKTRLENLYSEQSLSEKQILESKDSIFDVALKNKPVFSAYDYVGTKAWNNASVAITSTYGTDYSDFQESFMCYVSAKNNLTGSKIAKDSELSIELSNVWGYLQQLRELSNRKTDPREALVELCAQ